MGESELMKGFARKVRSKAVKCLSFVRINYFRFMGINIGKNCFLSSDARLDVRRGKITIGNNVNIASGTYVLSHTGYRPMTEEVETIIEDNVKIFVNSVILPGVRIGRDSIVGAGSVVMRDVPPSVIVMGNPARIIQQLGPEDPMKSST